MKFLFFLATFLISINAGKAQSTAQKNVSIAVERLRINLINPDQEELDKLVSDELSYGHSSGLIETKKEFIESLITKKFNIESLEITDQTIQVKGKTAIVRHHFSGTAHDKGKSPANISLGILLIWEKKNGKWVLITRQAYPYPN